MEVLPEACWQRCYVHFLRNGDYLPRKVADDCLVELRRLYDRRNAEEAAETCGLAASLAGKYQSFAHGWKEVSEVLCLGPVYYSSFGSDFAKARERPAVPPEPRGYGGAQPPFQRRQPHLLNLCPNWMANWLAAILQVSGGFVHDLVMLRKAR